MRGKISYKEEISSKWITNVISIIPLVFLALFLYQIFVGPIGENPAPTWFFLATFLILFVLIINFYKLVITITSKSILVRYGIFKRVIPFENIKKCYLDNASWFFYGGWGIRITIFKGKWRLAYITPGSGRVVITLKKGGFREFVFSSKDPVKVIEVIGKQSRN